MKRKPKEPDHFCRDCVHAKDHHNVSFCTGKNIMAKCDIIGYDVLLSQRACGEFENKF
jgi:hypothetical protein